MQKTLENSWSRNVLIHQIDTALYDRQGGALTNVQEVLPAPQSDLAQSLLKGFVVSLRDSQPEGIWHIVACTVLIAYQGR